MKKARVLFFILVTLFFIQCAKTDFVILSGSENEPLEEILKDFGSDNGYNIVMKYKGSVDIMLDLQEEQLPYDAIWPANSMWISLGDKQRRVKYIKSIMVSPVIFGIKKSVAEKLGFVGKTVTVKDLQNAIVQKKLKFMMTSATQSNSGASAYFGFLYAMLGNPEMITLEDLKKRDLKIKMRELFSGIHRSSGSSGWLKDLFLKSDYDAMVNYESVIIETNLELIKMNKEPLYAVYPVDGLVLSDSPLGFISQNDEKKEIFFKKLQDYLLSDEVQKKILDLGRRTGFGGVIKNADPKIFNPDWGIDVNKTLSYIKMPSSEVIYEALNFYQSQFRKPSLTVFCLDYSGSMRGVGEKQLKEAMQLLVKTEKAKRYLLQASEDDITIVIPFSHEIKNIWVVQGNNEKELENLRIKIVDMAPGGGTDIYLPIIEGLRRITPDHLKTHIPAIILMTDGAHNGKTTFKDLQKIWTEYFNQGMDVPVFSILFGEASEDELKQIAELTKARIFDGRKDLVRAFKNAKGYN